MSHKIAKQIRRVRRLAAVQRLSGDDFNQPRAERRRRLVKAAKEMERERRLLDDRTGKLLRRARVAGRQVRASWASARAAVERV